MFIHGWCTHVQAKAPHTTTQYYIDSHAAMEQPSGAIWGYISFSHRHAAQSISGQLGPKIGVKMLYMCIEKSLKFNIPLRPK